MSGSDHDVLLELEPRSQAKKKKKKKKGSTVAVDGSPAGHEIVAHGAVEIVPDETFVRAFRFTAPDDHLTLEPHGEQRFLDEVTVEVWVRLRHFDMDDAAGLVAAFQEPDHPTAGYGLGVLADGRLTFGAQLEKAGPVSVDSGDARLTLNDWRHVAATFDGAQMRLFLDGEQVASHGVEDGDRVTLPSPAVVRIGRRMNGPVPSPFEGSLAHVRLYGTALSSEDVRFSRIDDVPALSEAEQNYPISFSLLNNDGESVLYITNERVGQEMTLDLRNRSRSDIEFVAPAPGKRASATRHHFELIFRPGTIDPESMVGFAEGAWDQLVGPAGWLQTNGSQKVAKKVPEEEAAPLEGPFVGAGPRIAGVLRESGDQVEKDRFVDSMVLFQATGWSVAQITDEAGVHVYLLCEEGLVLPARGRVTLNLHHVVPASEGWTRGSLMELKYRDHHADKKASLKGFAEQRLALINRRGKKNIPLQFGFVGSNQVLADGSTVNTLLLRISNDSNDESIPLQPVGGSGETQLNFWFQESPVADQEATEQRVADEKEQLTQAKDDLAEDLERTQRAQMVREFLAKRRDRRAAGEGELRDEWALGTPSQVGGIHIYRTDQTDLLAVPGERLSVPGVRQGPATAWRLLFTDQKELGPHEHVELLLTGVVATGPTGPTQLYVRYMNIPGYWDGEVALEIEKTPIIVNRGRVGIGTRTPGRALQVGDKFHERESEAIVRLAHRHGEDARDWDVGVGDEALFGHRNNLGFRDVAGDRTIVTLQSDDQGGNVGVGTTKPTQPLDVAREGGSGIRVSNRPADGPAGAEASCSLTAKDGVDGAQLATSAHGGIVLVRSRENRSAVDIGKGQDAERTDANLAADQSEASLRLRHAQGPELTAKARGSSTDLTLQGPKDSGGNPTTASLTVVKDRVRLEGPKPGFRSSGSNVQRLDHLSLIGNLKVEGEGWNMRCEVQEFDWFAKQDNGKTEFQILPSGVSGYAKVRALVRRMDGIDATAFYEAKWLDDANSSGVVFDEVTRQVSGVGELNFEFEVSQNELRVDVKGGKDKGDEPLVLIKVIVEHIAL